MTHASLFSGIGGAELAAEWMGWENLFHCEIQEFPRRVLEYWYPNSKSYEDITKTDFTEWRGKVDVLTGGFPCQPFSLAGRRAGAADDRYLWPHMLRAIREIQPTWVVGENVAGLLTMVQPGDEAKMGRTDDIFDENYIYREERRFTLDEICEGLEREGYSVQPFIVPACAVGAPHRRDRVWIVAHADGTGLQEARSEQQAAGAAGDGQEAATDTSRNGDSGRPGAVREEVGRQDYELRAEPFEHGGLQTMAAADTDSNRRRQRKNKQVNVSKRNGETDISCRSKNEVPAHAAGIGRDAGELHDGEPAQAQEEERGEEQFSRADCPQDRWRDFPTQSPVCGGDDGVPIGLAGISFPRWRSESIKALGNAIVPQVAYEIFRAIAIAAVEDNGDKFEICRFPVAEGA